ncbi:hypothetical protein PUNSTDRAFT_130316 [Punctularia strigosozonata HHB-11173 SS5]|uniref:uncharacterized protein n=1 Tax=Punctularia strigosozonata (strain HHB-11173) TaxID=741275 RepID=UPI000441657A|nr:uncharacterized protein PUNSTDRAFT_130316 [Punctularia strigosozonata HHB-11173 SS5]EIN14693.1 hypothetical protein PUNSTDRAFT_130316 [Punctularia strigosozonata HHB-11173 SS5]
MAAIPVAFKLSLGSTFGAAFIGTMISTMLYGLTTLQTYIYFSRFRKDNLNLKILVAAIWALDTVHSTLMADKLNNPEVSILVNLMVSVLVQAFFAKRIFIVASPSTRWWIVSPVMLLIAAHFGFGIVTIVSAIQRKALVRLREIFHFATLPFAVVTVAADVAIAGSLCVLLYNRRTGFRRSNNVIHTLIVYAVNRCLLTSFAATAELITLDLKPDTLWFLGIDFVIGKLYANSFLATLLAREGLRQRDTGDTDGSNTISLPSFRPRTFDTSGQNSGSTRTPVPGLHAPGVLVKPDSEQTQDIYAIPGVNSDLKFMPSDTQYSAGHDLDV